MPTTHQLGDTLTHNSQLWRVVRVIRHSETLFQGEDDTLYIIEESYLELKSLTGDIDHIEVAIRRFPYVGVHSEIRGLEPIPYLERQLKEAPNERI